MEKQITMKLPEEMYSDLRKLSIQKDNTPLANLIKKAIDDYFRKNRLKVIYKLIFIISIKNIIIVNSNEIILNYIYFIH